MRAVAGDEKYLNPGEHVVVSTRTHVKALIGAVFSLLVVVFVASYLSTVIADRAGDGVRTPGLIALWVIAAVALVRWTVQPFIRWYTTTYTFTNRRFIQRSGFISKEGRTIPLNRISGVDFEIGVIDRMLGCGTLVVSDASENGRVPLKDIPRVEWVQMKVAEELHRLTTGEPRSDDGT